MTGYIAIGSAMLGTALASNIRCMLLRMTGGALICVAAVVAIEPAFAAPDQTLRASDGAQVLCNASAKDLTRISLVEDAFAAVSKINSGDAASDFSVVNEPVRGDIYLSVPEGYARPTLSFFATTRRGYVYKFVCRPLGDEAVQVFIANPAIKAEDGDGAVADRAATGQAPEDAAIELVRAMYANKVGAPYEMRQRSLRPVHVGNLKVQMIAEYQGETMTGRVLRIENTGTSPTTLTEATVAPASALAVSIAEPNLAPGKITTAYLVSAKGK
ncbi:type-F conjugative transfer system secretin TraK [Sphingomonas sp. Leaf4]|uniref:type-F conjugative transfer system secretin TraK n=1 Tax=Sphingomonas sp. Leaf4 TaxID=2876553 RepID=UPI001E5DE343|nr:type-F conjugative transfer system secretin TraK [Sphingomonas sp. Leaf4]